MTLNLNSTQLREVLAIFRMNAINGSNSILYTRNIAEKCNVSIYTARHRLLALEEMGIIKGMKSGRSFSWKVNYSIESLNYIFRNIAW